MKIRRATNRREERRTGGISLVGVPALAPHVRAALIAADQYQAPLGDEIVREADRTIARAMEVMRGRYLEKIAQLYREPSTSRHREDHDDDHI